jgi:hypothetical protein
MHEISATCWESVDAIKWSQIPWPFDVFRPQNHKPTAYRLIIRPLLIDLACCLPSIEYISQGVALLIALPGIEYKVGLRDVANTREF